MPRSCNAKGCNGNYPGEPYSLMVSFPNKEKHPDEWDRWVSAMPNERKQLEKLKEIWICKKHFDCEFVSCRGGTRPTDPPSIFPGIPTSCFKQNQTKPRTTTLTSSDVRREKQDKREEELDKIRNYDNFVKQCGLRYAHFKVIADDKDEELFMSLTDPCGRKVIQFLHFRKVESPFGFLYLVEVEKNGLPLSKNLFSLQKNSLISKWSQIDSILLIVKSHEASSFDYLQKVLEYLDMVSDLHSSSFFQFLRGQLQLLLVPPNGRRFDKHTLVVAAELFSISASAYKMLRRANVLALPCVTILKQILRCSFQDANLKALFQNLKPQQKLVNLLFDEVKLTQTIRFSGGHILGFATNVDNVSDATLANDVLATHAMVIEIVCHHGGPKYILRVTPVAKLNATGLKSILEEAISAVINAGGTIISLICDNCPTNQGVYRLFGGPGKTYLEHLGISVFFIYDYVHIFKNIRNNWITVKNKELEFSLDNVTYTASWADVESLYNEDRNTTLRLTKLTHTSVYPKPLQRQSVPLVCQVFNEKTVAAMVSLQKKLLIKHGTIEFIRLVTNWFHMMNVKDKYTCIKLRDNFRSPWTSNCVTFEHLTKACEVISTCAWKGGRNRTLKMTKSTSDAFIVSTQTNVDVANYLLNEKGFEYFLPAVQADELLEKFFGKTRMRNGGNFYIDVTDVVASAKVTNLHALSKYDISPQTLDASHISCLNCQTVPNEDDVEFLNDFELTETETLLASDETLKEKVVYIGGHLVHKFGEPEMDLENDTEISTEFLNELNRGGLSVPTFSTIHFVHCAFRLSTQLPPEKIQCRPFLSKLLSYISAPFASNPDACRTLSNIIMKAFVIDKSDKEREQGCLRRREKLST